MSIEIGIFYSKEHLSEEDAAEWYIALISEKNIEPWLETDPSVDAFYNELTGRFPDDGSRESPWAASLTRSAGHVIVNILSSKAGEIIPVIVDLARKHDLNCFDPQSGKLMAAASRPHALETGLSLEDIEKQKTLGISPFVDYLDMLLVPHGFNRKRRIWRREGQNTVAALELENDPDYYDIWLCVWLKSKGPIEPDKVRPAPGFRHIVQNISDLLPERMDYRMLRAMSPGTDYCDYILNPRYQDQETIRRVAPHYEPKEQLTMDWRQKTMRAAIEGYVLPWFNDVETKPGNYRVWGKLRRWLSSFFESDSKKTA